MQKLDPYHALTDQFLQPGLGKLYWSQGFSTLGGGLVAIFIPIYLLKLHYSLAAVLSYMIFYGLFCIPALYIALHLVPKLGSNRTMGIASICQAIFLGLLITLPSHHWPLFSLSALAAWVNSMYYPAFHANFAMSRTPNKAGRQLSYIYTVMAIASAVAPAVGGILATVFNIKLVYGIAAGIFLVAAIPMFWGRKGFKPPDFKLARLKHTNIKPDLSAYGGWAIVETTEEVVWPIIIFLIVSSYASIGLLSSVVITTGIFTTLYIGRRLEHKGEKHYIKRGSATVSLTNFGRIFAGGVGGVFSMNFLSGISFHILEVSLFTRFYRHVASGDTLEYLFAMEAFYGITIAAFYSVLLILTAVFSVHAVLAVGLFLTIPASYFATRMR
jgi:MFS family permease